jgi:hypothetical protein
MWTIAKIKQANKEAGQFFFSPDTMRFFRSRVLDFVTYGDDQKVYFITSEKYVSSDYRVQGRRLYTLRAFIVATGRVDTIGEFQAYTSSRAAKAAANKLAAVDGTIWKEAQKCQQA